MSYNERIIIGLIAVLLSVIPAILNYKMLGIAERYFAFTLMFKLLSELIADYSARVYHNNMPVIGIVQPIEFFLICLYFNYSVDAFYKNKVGTIIGVSGLFFGVCNYFFIQSPYVINSLFLILKGVLIIALCLYAFYRLLILDDDIDLTANVNFWINSLMLFYWSTTTLLWGAYDMLISELNVSKVLIHNLLILINVITYLGFGTVFLLYKKMKTTHGR